MNFFCKGFFINFRRGCFRKALAIEKKIQSVVLFDLQILDVKHAGKHV
jgi:hypothetical protein